MIQRPGSFAWLRLLFLPLLVWGCADREGGVPATALADAEAVLQQSVGLSVTAPKQGASELRPGTSRSQAAASPAFTVTRETTFTQVLFGFEGLNNGSAVPELDRTAFPGWFSLIDADVVGSGSGQRDYSIASGAFAHEPSASTAIFWNSTASDRDDPSHFTREIVFDRPVHRVTARYAACGYSCARSLRPPPRTNPIPLGMTAYGEDGAALGSVSAAENYNEGPGGDPTGTYNQWDPMALETAGDNRIYRVVIRGYSNQMGIDDLELLRINFKPIALPGGPYEVPEGSAVAFDGSVSFDPVDASGLPKPGADAVTYHWSFGDGNTSTLAKPTHTYANSGTYTARLVVTDPNLLTSDTASVAVEVSNVAPAVDAGGGSVAAGVSFSPGATFSDPGGANDAPYEFTVQWGDGSQSTGTVSSWQATMAVPATHVYGAPGDYTIRVTVTDQNGASGEDTGEVRVVNQPPSAELAPPAAGQEGSPLTLDASGSSDPEGSALSYTWDFGDGSPEVTTETPTTTHGYADQGSYTVTVTVADPYGGTDEAQRTATVASVAPTATFAHTGPVDEGEAFQLSLTDPSDPSSADVAAGFRYAFDCGSGYGAFGSSSARSCPTTDSGSRAVRAQIKDKDDAATEYTATVQVNNVAPTVDAGSGGEVREGDPFTLDGSFTDPGSGEAGWAVQIGWGDGSAATTATVSAWAAVMTIQRTHTYAEPGSYTVTLTVTDPDGGSGSAHVEVLVKPRNQPPSALAAAVQTMVECTAPTGTPVQLDGTDSQDPDGDALDYQWRDASGAVIATGATPTVVLPRGTHTLTLRVTDPHGATDQSQVTVTVRDSEPPTLSATASPGALWPPNHKYHRITVAASAADACSAPSAIAIVGHVESNQADDARGKGDGNTTADIRVTRPDGTTLRSSNTQPRVSFQPGDRLELRAERYGTAGPRIYTITLSATDASGNATTSTAAVRVQHDQGGGDEDDDGDDGDDGDDDDGDLDADDGDDGENKDKGKKGKGKKGKGKRS